MLRFPVSGKNSLAQWTHTVSPLKVVRNWTVIFVCRYLPSLRLKNLLYRAIGVKLGRDVAVGLSAVLDVFFPELITIGSNTVIGYNATILCHEYLIREWRTGPVVIGRDVMVGANALILPGVAVGDGAVIAACSLVNADVPPGAMVAGVPAVQLTRHGQGPET
jgi:acetyltransferase-like isoleucine patch superfamily enzyme